MDFGEFPTKYLVHSSPKAKDEIYKAFSLFSVEAEQGALWDEEAKRLATL